MSPITRRAFGIGAVFGCNRDFHTITGGKNHSLMHARLLAQVGKSVGQTGLIEGHLFAHLYWGGLVIQARKEEPHRAELSSPAWAIQVRADPHTTAMVINAARRPRHPALARRKIVTSNSTQVISDNVTRLSPIRDVPD